MGFSTRLLSLRRASLSDICRLLIQSVSTLPFFQRSGHSPHYHEEVDNKILSDYPEFVHHLLDFFFAPTSLQCLTNAFLFPASTRDLQLIKSRFELKNDSLAVRCNGLKSPLVI